MADRLAGMQIAFLMANEGVEQIELTDPWRAVEAEGGRPVLVAPEPGTVQAFNHREPADRFPVDMTVAEADPKQFAGLILPGGVVNPDRLRTIPRPSTSPAPSSSRASRWPPSATRRGR